MEELKVNFNPRNDSSTPEIRGMIDSLEYLQLCVKESLRHSNAAFFSLAYKSLEDISIWGVSIPKGATLFQCLHAIHYDPQEWFYPKEFIPERFDPESELFNCPGENIKKKRSKYSFIPFSAGLRKWPGMNLAMLELKTISALFLKTFEYELDPNQKANDYLRFSLRSQSTWKVMTKMRMN